MTDVLSIAKNAKQASKEALVLQSGIKNKALNLIADALENEKQKILKANMLDIENAKKTEISSAMLNRLKLDENKLRDMIQGVRDTAKLKDPVNQIIWTKNIAEGITLEKVSCPIGVIGVIFEARPDVISQISSLALKSSNAVVLKGGTEAAETNKAIFEIITAVLSKIDGFPKNMISLIFSREDVKKMLELDEYMDLIIPRGSNALVKYIKENTKIAVLGHADGVCHIYAAESADFKKACSIITDAKCQYPAACNSVETVLVNEKIKKEFLPVLFKKLRDENVSINSDSALKSEYPEFITGIVNDWHTEYGNKTLSVKTVKNTDEAVKHINQYGSGHTDCIITEDNAEAEKFMMLVDSSGVYKNISTRFADGFRYGFGAEAGISTGKIHARGPAGLEALAIYKYKLIGNGDIVQDFISGKRKFIK